MWRPLRLLLLCCALSGLDAQEPDQGAQTSPLTGASPSPVTIAVGVREAVTQSPQRDAPDRAPTAEPLEEEFDNQENVISQLLGDYDKVKTVSSGSDCVCRCIVRPIKRADCSRIHDSDHVSAQEHYTVETITKGTDCKKCVCMAPPSAVNPCEGEYRFKKLQEASKDDIKLATIIDLLEGSLYGMDLLKLHSVTTKLLTRVDNMEKAFARNFTERAREKERMKEKAKEKEKKAQQKKKKVNDLERVPQKSGAAAYANKQKKYEEQLKKNAQQDGLEQPTRNKTGPQKPIKDKTVPKPPIKEKNSLVIRGVTFYKAEESYTEEEEEDEENRKQKTILAATNFQIDDQFQPTPVQPLPTEGQTKSSPAPAQPPTASPSTIQQTTAATTSAPTTIKPTTEFITSIQTTTAAPATTHLTSTTQPSTTIQPPTGSDQRTTVPTNIDTPNDDGHSVKPVLVPRSRLSWTESPADQPKTTKKPGVCKDTLASISEPVQQNSYGLRDGAWMRDARGHGNVIYLTNDHFGNSLQEFRDLQSFKSGQSSNSYKLPYSYTGTGHVVYNGAFYYNRAFSRDIIRYDLRHRYVAAWTTLHDALLEEQAHKPQSEVEFAVDESGLWLLYPALDTEGFHQEVILLIHINSRDLQPIETFRTGLRRGRYGNSFLVCGVLYAVDSMERHYANVTYAFDTHTLTHTMPSLAITNMHMHTSQLAYCPLDKKLYAWDNGHQMIYDVIFAY